MKYHYQLLFSLCVLGAGYGLMQYFIHSKADAEKKTKIHHIPQVRTIICTAFNQAVSIQSQGTVRAFRESNIASEVDGEISFLSNNFLNGQKVTAGELLLRIEPEPYELALHKSKAQMAQAQLALSQEQAQAEQAQIDWVDSGRELSKANDLVLRKPQLAMARAGLEAAKADLRQSQRRLERCEIFAPYNGYIEKIVVGRGQFIRASTPLAHIIASNKIEIPLAIQNSDLLFLDIPASNTASIPVIISSEIAQQRQQWHGSITRFMPRMSGKQQQFIAIAEIDMPFAGNAPLLPDLFIEAQVQGKIPQGLIEIPRASIRDGSYVWLVDSNNTLQKRSVHIVRYNPDGLSLKDLGETVLAKGDIHIADRICLTRLTVMGNDMQVEYQDHQEKAVD
ncbi:MAG: efflux RND transporter periplasmic adaptor subunit [Planctomycetes bacterium]|nr:efflux RND transporter periplasmic adaptor subunit [Planctomycetota bacterium]